MEDDTLDSLDTAEKQEDVETHSTSSSSNSIDKISNNLHDTLESLDTAEKQEDVETHSSANSIDKISNNLDDTLDSLDTAEVQEDVEARSTSSSSNSIDKISNNLHDILDSLDTAEVQEDVEVTSTKSSSNSIDKTCNDLPICPKTLTISLQRLSPTLVDDIRQRQRLNNIESHSKSGSQSSHNSSKSEMSSEDEEISEFKKGRSGLRLRKTKIRKERKRENLDNKILRHPRKVNYKEKSDESLSSSQHDDDDSSDDARNKHTKNDSESSRKRKLDNRKSKQTARKSLREAKNSESDSDAKEKKKPRHQKESEKSDDDSHSDTNTKSGKQKPSGSKKSSASTKGRERSSSSSDNENAGQKRKNLPNEKIKKMDKSKKITKNISKSDNENDSETENSDEKKRNRKSTPSDMSNDSDEKGDKQKVKRSNKSAVATKQKKHSPSSSDSEKGERRQKSNERIKKDRIAKQVPKKISKSSSDNDDSSDVENEAGNKKRHPKASHKSYTSEEDSDSDTKMTDVQQKALASLNTAKKTRDRKHSSSSSDDRNAKHRENVESDDRKSKSTKEKPISSDDDDERRRESADRKKDSRPQKATSESEKSDDDSDSKIKDANLQASGSDKSDRETKSQKNSSSSNDENSKHKRNIPLNERIKKSRSTKEKSKEQSNSSSDDDNDGEVLKVDKKKGRRGPEAKSESEKSDDDSDSDTKTKRGTQKVKPSNKSTRSTRERKHSSDGGKEKRKQNSRSSRSRLRRVRVTREMSKELPESSSEDDDDPRKNSSSDSDPRSQAKGKKQASANIRKNHRGRDRHSSESNDEGGNSKERKTKKADELKPKSRSKNDNSESDTDTNAKKVSNLSSRRKIAKSSSSSASEDKVAAKKKKMQDSSENSSNDSNDKTTKRKKNSSDRERKKKDSDMTENKNRQGSLSPDITKITSRKSSTSESTKSLCRKLDIKEVRVKLKRVKINGRHSGSMKTEKTNLSSEDSKGDSSNSSRSSGDNSDSKNERRKSDRRKMSEANRRTCNGKSNKRSASTSDDDDEFERRRSDRGNKYVKKKRGRKEKPKKKTKKISYDDDEDYTVTETPSDSDDGGSDPDFRYSQKKKKKGSKSSAKGRPRPKPKKKVNTSTEEENHVDSPNESDKEFDRMLLEEEKEKRKDETADRENREKRKLMKVAKTISTNVNGPKIKKGGHQTFCKECKTGGELVCCLSCYYSFHLECLDPPLDEVPPGSWDCPYCVEEPLPGKVNKIVTWRWENKENRRRSRTKVQESSKRKKEYFVQWAGESFWKCSWVSEFKMIVYHKNLLIWYKKEQEDIELNLMEEESVDYDETDPLYERFYRYGVKPQWLTVHRILNQRFEDEDKQYLVKWRGLSYHFLSWEDQDDDEIPDFKKFQDIYHEWRIAFNGDSDHLTRQKQKGEPSKSFKFKYINKPPKDPITDLEKKYKSQPPFIDTESGLSLHDYQLESLNWLRKCWNNQNNTILADEMGLGKTIQAIMFIYSLFKEGHCHGPFLVTAPLSTVANWEREFELWAPDLYVVTYAGMQDERIIIRQHEFTYRNSSFTSADKTATKVRGPLKFHVLLTSYEFVTRDLECLSSIDWAVMIVDEAHRLKNNKSKFHLELEEYRADYKLLLTGTPLQNNLVELFNILKHLCPRKRTKMNALQEEFEKNLDDAKHAKLVAKLKNMIEPHMLRRVKEDVLKNLPSKSEIIVKVELSPMQTKYYKYILTKNFEGLNSRNSGNWATLIAVFVDLQKCCNHPYLFSTAMMEAPVTEDEIYELSALTEASGKLSVLQKMLKKLKVTGHRVLIFSHYTKMLDILEDFLNGLHYDYERIDGNVKGPDRQASIDRFNNPNSTHFIFLLSTKAGGLGINLATADTVIIYDSDWNPHNDIQAFSRAHRIGQTKPVMIYRFITRNSIEERIVQVAQSKMMLNHVVFEAGRGDLKFSVNKSALDQIIRHGTQELFKEGRNVRDNFTDEAIEELLDRSKAAFDRKENATDSETNDILSEVKVVSYVAKDENNELGELETVGDELITDEDYWEQLLGPRHKRVVEKTQEELGKRVRKIVNYKTGQKISQSSGDESAQSDSQDSNDNKDSDPDEVCIVESDSSVAIEDEVINKKETKWASIWKHFTKTSTKGTKSGLVATCKLCARIVPGKLNFVELKAHFERCKATPTSLTEKFENTVSNIIFPKVAGKSVRAKNKNSDVPNEDKKRGPKLHPVWSHFTKVEVHGRKRPNSQEYRARWQGVCKYCDKKVTRSTEQLINHLTKCKKLTRKP